MWRFNRKINFIIIHYSQDYQVKEQCVNCTYLNGQFAEECEMCGEPLSHRQHNGRKGSAGSNDHHLALKNPDSTFKIHDGMRNSSARGNRDDYY